jgi:hypothetical protein
MTEQTAPGAIWQRIDQLSDNEIAALTQAAIYILQSGSDDQSLRDLEAMPKRSLRDELQRSLAARAVPGGDAPDRIVGDPKLSRPVAIELLKVIAMEPDLAAEVENTYRAREKLLTGGVEIILAGALLVLVLKLRHVKVGKRGADISFSKLSDTAIKSVMGLLNPLKP